MQQGIYDAIMAHDVAKWINEKIEELPNSAKFRAFNSIRALSWANSIHASGLHIPACYCALHVTEEAVAAFVSTAKEAGYGEDAKINIRDHQAKAVVSLIAERATSFLQEFKPAIAYKNDEDAIILRLTDLQGEFQYGEASTGSIWAHDGEGQRIDNFYEHLKTEIGDVSELQDAVKNGQEARNEIFYATKTGLPSGFLDPTAALEREIHISLGLIWASIDIFRKKGNSQAFVAQALRTANLVISELKKKKST